METVKAFDFENNSTITMDINTLKRTYKENDVLGKPLRGMYHYEVIDAVNEILEKYNYQHQINEIFAAQNRDKRNPGVVINPEIENKYGEKSVEAHVLRRVYADINVGDFDNDELTTNVVVAFHQDAIQIAYGPMVKICHNQCILRPERVLSTERGTNVFDIVKKFDEYMQSLTQTIVEDHRYIERMKEYILTPQQILATIGSFMTLAVAKYSRNKEIHINDMYPLNISQISDFTEDMLIKQKENNEISMWDLYNVVTNLYKPDKMQIPNMLDQHIALNNYVHQIIG